MVSRNTKQKELLRLITDSLPEFFNADDVYAVAVQKDSSLGIATVYRFLKEQVHQKKLHSYLCERKTVYSQTKQHCHFIDERTGEVTHFEVNNLDFLQGKIPGSITSFSLEVRGKK